MQVSKTILDTLGRNRFLCKHDGTVRSGMEIVAFPFTWEWLKENKSLMETLFDILQTERYSATRSGNAGFHVHMSKGAFSHLHLYKFMRFIYFLPNRKFIADIAERKDRADGRSKWHYASFDTHDKHTIIQCAKEKHDHSGERYLAVNLRYAPTVELRIFGGVNTRPQFMKNMEFCKSVYEFTKDATIQKAQKLNDYIKYLDETRKNYKHLVSFIRDLRSNSIYKL
jgi:hypothetical protein